MNINWHTNTNIDINRNITMNLRRNWNNNTNMVIMKINFRLGKTSHGDMNSYFINRFDLAMMHNFNAQFKKKPCLMIDTLNTA